MVINGLDRQPLPTIVSSIVDMGFNCIRLVYALDTFYENPVIKAERLSENPDLVGLRAMEIFDIVVDELTNQGLMVILNNHVRKIKRIIKYYSCKLEMCTFI